MIDSTEDPLDAGAHFITINRTDDGGVEVDIGSLSWWEADRLVGEAADWLLAIKPSSKLLRNGVVIQEDNPDDGIDEN